MQKELNLKDFILKMKSKKQVIEFLNFSGIFLLKE